MQTYIAHKSRARKATNGMSLTTFGHGSAKITVIDGRELLTRTDSYLEFRICDDMYFIL